MNGWLLFYIMVELLCLLKRMDFKLLFQFNIDKYLILLIKNLFNKISNFNKLKVITNGNLKAYYMPHKKLYGYYAEDKIFKTN